MTEDHKRQSLALTQIHRINIGHPLKQTHLLRQAMNNHGTNHHKNPTQEA